MTAALILLLFVVCGVLALRLSSVHKDNAELRARIKSLKRQLVRTG